MLVSIIIIKLIINLISSI